MQLVQETNRYKKKTFWSKYIILKKYLTEEEETIFLIFL
ncbi:MAG: hypothetical protein BAJALOKI2v1_40085 [Promethearchaeota archaeon]|nr:MAG: hypothetical protein BAJALOKI2v1_40085 [Candidatus Lokiarchaeota archaeon]